MSEIETLEKAAPALWDHPNPVTLSFSSRETLRYCARKFEFNKFFTLPKREPQLPAEVGTALHKAWQNYLVHRDRELAAYTLLREYPLYLCNDPYDDRCMEACYGTLEKLIQNAGLVEYEVAQIECLDGKVRPAVEAEFEIWLDGVTIGGRPVLYNGFIDAILFNKLNGDYVVADLKTSRRNFTDLAGEYHFHGQCLPYSLVLQQLIGGELDFFTALYIQAYVDLLEPNVRMYPTKKSHDDVRDWFTGLYFDVKRLKEMYERGFFPRTEGGCVDKYGKPCRFLGVCSERDHEIAQNILLMDIETPEPKRKRNPWMRFVLEMEIR